MDTWFLLLLTSSEEGRFRCGYVADCLSFFQVDPSEIEAMAERLEFQLQKLLAKHTLVQVRSVWLDAYARG